jgi:hypothetical protein
MRQHNAPMRTSSIQHNELTRTVVTPRPRSIPQKKNVPSFENAASIWGSFLILAAGFWFLRGWIDRRTAAGIVPQVNV